MTFDLKTLIQTVGYLGVFGMVFAESGLLVGFFLPGDSLLFTAGFLASQGFLNIAFLAIGAFISAVLGDSAGYFIGGRYGKRLFTKEDSLLFHKSNLVKAYEFYKKHGGKTIVLARFIPIIRTFAPVVAGIGDMNYKKFVFFNIFGGFLWAVGLTYAGFYLGRSIPSADKYIIPAVLIIIVISLIPTFLHFLRHKEDRQKLLGL